MKKPTQKQGASSKVTPPLRKKNNQEKSDNTKDKQGFGSSGAGNKKKKRHAIVMGGEQDVGRYYWIWAVMVGFFLALFARAFYLQVMTPTFPIEVGEDKFKQMTVEEIGSRFINTKQTIRVQRGMITDTHGTPLAANAPLSTVVFSPYDYAVEYYATKKRWANAKTQKSKDKEQERLNEMDLKRLAAAANYPLEKLQQVTVLKDDIDVNDEVAVKKALPKGRGSRRLVLLNKVSPEVAGSLMALDFIGIDEEQTFKRYYLQAEPNATILGYMARSDNQEDDSYVGRAGIERKYEQRLAGENGQSLMLRGNRGLIKEVKEIKPVVPSQDVHLTLDSRLQYVLYKELEQVGRVQSARSSSGMVVDVLTGDVLAMSSWPSFNSNNLSERSGANERNRPVLDTFEPGSVMKPFTVAAALESGKYSTHSLIDTSPGSLRVSGGFVIRDSGNYGAITLAKLIQKSSNVASAKIALNLPTSAIADIQKRFGFGQKTALGLPAESSGFIKNPKEADTASRAGLSYGYGQIVTLAQLAQAYSALANQGVMHPLRLVKDEPMAEPKSVLDPKIAQSIVGMMELVTQKGGTARAAAIDGYRVAGKTGTTRRNNPNGGYYADQYRTLFAGIAPASNPRFVVVILVEDPRREHYGGLVAAPVFHNVMKEALRLYNVPFDKPLESTEKQSASSNN